jgi:superfamily II DNA or RNA helicase
VGNPQLIGDVVHNWFRLASDKKTVVFCVTRAHSRHICEEFKARGIKAEHLDGETPLDKRKAILERVKSGETQVLCNVFVATYGLDIPSLECAVLARPTRNIALYLQTVGRVLRPSEFKTEALVIDHAGAIDEHGFVDDFIPWSLDENSSVKERKEQQKKEKKEPKELTCGECGTVFKSSHNCPNCGFEIVPAGKPIPVHQADLQEVQREAAKSNREMTWEEKISFYGQLKQYCEDTGKKPGWAAHKYREKCGVWPNDSRLKSAPNQEVSETVRSWITSRNIAYAKRKAA